MKRRDLLALIGAALTAPALPEPIRAQQRPVIGYLGAENPELFASRLRSFRTGLTKAGYQEGHNLRIEYRWAEGHNDRLPALAADLVRNGVDAIAAPGSAAAALAAKAATSSIPIVFETGVDPVAAGLVGSLNRPGGNVTGITSLNLEIDAKRLELLHEVIPTATNFAFLVNPGNPVAGIAIEDLQAAARSLEVQLAVLRATSDQDFHPVFNRLLDLHVGGLVIHSDPLFNTRYAEMAALVRRHMMPAVHQSPEFAAAGGLMSYGGSVTESHTQAGFYVGRILKGERPGELPVQRVTKVEMVINLKAARLLKLEIPRALLATADEVIE